jgi:hypothetical protein
VHPYRDRRRRQVTNYPLPLCAAILAHTPIWLRLGDLPAATGKTRERPNFAYE